jgi:hypothetical protein
VVSVCAWALIPRPRVKVANVSKAANIRESFRVFIMPSLKAYMLLSMREVVNLGASTGFAYAKHVIPDNSLARDEVSDPAPGKCGRGRKERPNNITKRCYIERSGQGSLSQ